MANGTTTTCMVQVCTPGVMAVSMRVTTIRIRNMAMAYITGQMVGDMRECGRTASRMEKANMCCPMELLR